MCLPCQCCWWHPSLLLPRERLTLAPAPPPHPNLTTHTCLQSISQHFVLLSAIFAAPLILTCLAIWLAPDWYRRGWHRTALVLLIRLATTATCAVPYNIPEPPCSSCTSFGGIWLINSHCLTLCFVALGFPLPLR